jgi:hypothetical protein
MPPSASGPKLEEAAVARILIADVAGGIVLAKELGFRAQGEHAEALELQSLASGIYLVALQYERSTGERITRRFKLALVR